MQMRNIAVFALLGVSLTTGFPEFANALPPVVVGGAMGVVQGCRYIQTSSGISCIQIGTTVGTGVYNYNQQRQRDYEAMRRRQQQDYNQGRYKRAVGSYGGW
jgi:hypothetical protein